MQLQVPEYIRNLIPYVPGKPIEETQRELKIKTVIKLASNENPLGPSPKAVAAVAKVLKDAHRYPDSGAFRLKRAISVHLKTSPDRLIVGNGSNEIIDFIVRTYCLAGDTMVTSQAAFVAYKLCAQIHGVHTVETPLTPDLRFDLKLIAEEVRRTPRAKLVFIANPNNPTGTYVTDGELRGFLKQVAAIRGGSVLVVIDAAYLEYVTAKDCADPHAVAAEFSNVVVLRTFSKVYGLAGFRVGYGVAAASIISDLEKVRQPFNVNSLGLVAAEAALKDSTFVTRSRKANAQGMALWERELKRAGIPFWRSQANFLLADVQKGLGKSGVEVYQECLRKGVIFRPVANYGLTHALRIGVGTATENRIAIRALLGGAGSGTRS